MHIRESFNWYGTYTLYQREVRRFLKVYHQTMIAPVVSALIFLAIFFLGLGAQTRKVNGIALVDFIGYGLIIMMMIQNSFANTSSSLIMAKVIGYINDILMPPFDGAELVLAYIMGSITRGVMVGMLLTLALTPFIHFQLYNIWLLVFYSIMACIILGLLGIISALIANNFDQSSAVTNYIIMPLSFLSGTFYSVKNLPSYLLPINYFNPLFYLIDGFRYSLTGHTDGYPNIGVLFLSVIAITLWVVTVRLINIGWRIKA